MIDTAFDFRADARGRDPDQHSPTLRRYHRLLWSKPLPNGAPFELDDTRRGAYLYHRSGLGEFWLASDSVMQTFVRWSRMKPLVSQFDDAENAAFMTLAYTIGGMMVFPGNRVDGKPTINGARGFSPKIADRIDLTLECIRRHYLGSESPLGETLARYRDFFELFGDFRGYVEFFLLQDLVTGDGSTVRFFAPFDAFATSGAPKDIETYTEFRRCSIEFIDARNRRIDWLVNGLGRGSVASPVR